MKINCRDRARIFKRMIEIKNARQACDERSRFIPLGSVEYENLRVERIDLTAEYDQLDAELRVVEDVTPSINKLISI